jgi:hypothetical protein
MFLDGIENEDGVKKRPKKLGQYLAVEKAPYPRRLKFSSEFH